MKKAAKKKTPPTDTRELYPRDLCLHELRTERGLTQAELAKTLGLSQSALSNWETGRRQPDLTALCRMAAFFGVSVEELLDVSRQTQSPVTRSVPVYSRFTGTSPLDNMDKIEESIAVTEPCCQKGRYLGIRVRDHRMEPLFRQGDILLIRYTPFVQSGDWVLLSAGEEEAFVRRLIAQDDGYVLQAAGTAERSVRYSTRDLSTLPVTVLGKVVQVRRNLERNPDGNETEEQGKRGWEFERKEMAGGGIAFDESLRGIAFLWDDGGSSAGKNGAV